MRSATRLCQSLDRGVCTREDSAHCQRLRGQEGDPPADRFERAAPSDNDAHRLLVSILVERAPAGVFEAEAVRPLKEQDRAVARVDRLLSHIAPVSRSR